MKGVGGVIDSSYTEMTRGTLIRIQITDTGVVAISGAGYSRCVTGDAVGYFILLEEFVVGVKRTLNRLGGASWTVVALRTHISC